VFSTFVHPVLRIYVNFENITNFTNFEFANKPNLTCLTTVVHYWETKEMLSNTYY